MGSFAGLIGGLAVSVFSKPLAVVIGLLVFGIQVFFSTPSTQPSSRSAATEAL